MQSILVVDDEAELRRHLVDLLGRQNYKITESSNGLEALEQLNRKDFALVLSDVRMPHCSGLELLQQLKEKQLSSSVILMTAHGSIRDAVEAIRQGAFDYIEKPIQEADLLQVVERAVRAREMLVKVNLSAPMAPDEQRECVGTSQSMKRVFGLVERLSRVNTSVLVRGENGTGKELVARAIHYNSPRKNSPFVAVNCAAIPDNLIESELFGHEKGAFTGADQRKIGKFQFAAGGTLFLDEIGDTSPATQVKLLRVLQEHSFMPVGSNREIKADVRIIAATNRDLEKAIQEGKFREDLFYRLSVLPIFLPPLRERKDDLRLLIQHFVEKFNQEHHRTIRTVQAQALEAMELFHWPGNIRELENAIEHAFVVETTDTLTYFSVPEYIRKATRKMLFKATHSAQHLDKDLDWELTKEAFERDFIIQALRHNGGKINLTAETSKIPKNTLLRKIKKYRITPQDYLGRS